MEKKTAYVYRFDMNVFLEIEPILKEWYGIDRNSISNEICDSVDNLKMMNDPNLKNYINVTEEGDVCDVFAYAMDNLKEFLMPVKVSYHIHTIADFCEKYEMTTATAFNLLNFLYILSQRTNKVYITESEYAEQDTEIYCQEVRPEMLKLYMAMHSDEKCEPCKISFGNSKPVVISGGVPWLHDALDEYLNKYLGVSSYKEAEREHLTVYGKKAVAKLKGQAARYMCGTYFFLQTFPALKSHKERSVTNKQSRIIADLLIRLGLLDNPIDYEDGRTIRSQLNYYLKTYDSIDELIAQQQYRTSPNNPARCFRY